MDLYQDCSNYNPGVKNGLAPGITCLSWTQYRENASNISKTLRPIKAEFHMEPQWVGGVKVCLLHLGHMTKMAVTPIYGQNPLKFTGTKGPMALGLGIQHWGRGPNKV